MKYTNRIVTLLIVMLSAVLMTACSDDNDSVANNGYGYIQVDLKKAATRGLVEGNPLEYLDDARKVKLSLRSGGKTIEQTLNLQSAGAEASEYGLTSENLKIHSGEYQLLGYAIYGDYKDGDMAEVLQVCEPDEPTTIVVREGQLTRQELLVEAKEYGYFSAHLIRLEPVVTRAGQPIYSELFSYSDIDSVQFVMERTVGGVTFREDHKVKAYRGDSDVPVFDTDSIRIQTGDYKISHFELFNSRRQFMYAQDVEIPFKVAHYDLTSAEVGVQLPDNELVRDGIALKQIWDAMGGESWSWHEPGDSYGGNWVFKMSDGSPRPISAWVRQIGVAVVNGRVVTLNLGSFNPIGDVPDAIGQLTGLEKLYLGMHTDEIYYQLEGVGDIHYALNPYQLGLKGENTKHRMEIARERTRIRRANMEDFATRASRVIYKGETDEAVMVQGMRYAQDISTYSQHTSDVANRITGISEEIGKLTNLQELYIANTLIRKLPSSMANLTSLTDLELFNNPFEDIDGEIFRDMKELALVNIVSLYKMDEAKIQDMLDKMCTYANRIQLLYINYLKLTHLPKNLNKLTDLRLLDATFNKITHVESLLPIAPIQMMLNYNEISEIPADFINPDDLELFACTDNKLKKFPVVLSNLSGPYTIQEVDLTNNQMHGFQQGWAGIRVEKLKLGSNYMGRGPKETTKGEFPREFSDTHSVINYLVLSRNNIDTIRNAAIADIKYVQALDISCNYLTSLPGYFNAEHFPYLTGVEISHNCFDEFPNNILNVTSMGQLLCTGQGYYRDPEERYWIKSMTKWPDYLHTHPSLNTVDFSDNDFRTVTNFPTNLTSLNVIGNPNIKLVIPEYIFYKIKNGLFQLRFTEDQDVTVE